MREGEGRNLKTKMLSKFMALAVITGCALVEAHGASFMTKLWDFNGTSGHKDPVGALIKGDDGNYYGTSWQGGNNNTGSVYRYSPTTGIFYEFYSFTGGTDGANPYSGLTQGQDATGATCFYGTTTTGGANGYGTIFRVSYPALAFTNLYSFGSGNGAGGRPYGDLKWGVGGLLYGTTAFGGPNDFGCAFAFDPRANVMRGQTFFTSMGNDGGWPYGELAAGAVTVGYSETRTPGTINPLETQTWTTNCLYYGTTWAGGANLLGCVYEFSFNLSRTVSYLGAGSTTFGYGVGGRTTRYSFAGGVDGYNPYAGLWVASDGNYYGSTVNGGSNNYGTIYRFTSGNAYTSLYSFKGGALGGNPYGLLVSGLGSVNLIGTTINGGSGDNGTIFKLNASGPTALFTNLYSFTGYGDGSSPYAGLMNTKPGVFAGTTGGGGAQGLGTIFQFMPDGAVLTVTASPAVGGSVTGGGTYLVNELVWIYAVANTNTSPKYAFISWNDGVTDNPRAITMPASNITYTAIFSQYADVSVTANPAAGGTAGGSGRYPIGLIEQITASANPGWTFTGWGDGGFDNPRTITVPATQVAYTANFVQAVAYLSVNGAPANGGFVTGAGTYPVGSSQIISVTPTNGYLFGCWDDSDTNPVRTVTVPANGASYSASFISPATTITLLVNTNIGGAALGGGSYAQWSTQTISAVSYAGWKFVQWSDGNAADTRTLVVPESNVTYTAIFAPAVLITAQVNPGSLGGGVTGGGTYYVGQSAQLYAVPNSNYLFSSWSCSGTTFTDNPLIFTAVSNAVYTATFIPKQGTITVVASSTNGTVLGTGLYLAGTSQRILATANAGWYFTGWDDGNTQNPRDVIVTVAGATYTANFAQQMATVTVLVNTNVGGSATGGGTFALGTPHQISATPNWGWTFAGWDDGDVSNPRIITTLQGNVTYTAMFTRQMATVVVDVNTNVGGTATGGGSYPVGTILQITATPNANWLFAQWDDGSLVNPRTIMVPASNVTYTAVFGAAVTITLQANPAAGGSVWGGGLYPAGLPAVLTASASANWAFSSWVCGGVTNANNPLVIIAASNAIWTANFQQVMGTLIVQASPTNGTTLGSGSYPAGSTQIISATPNPGWYFTGWNDGNIVNPRNVTVTMGTNIYTANLAQMWTVTAQANTNAGGIVTGGGNYPAGTSQTLTATPNVGWQFVQWLDGSVANPRNIVVPASNITYTAVFASSARITVAVNPPGAGTASGGGTYTIGSIKTLTAVSNLNWAFTSWTCNGFSTNVNPVGITVVSNADYVANFRPATVMVTVRPNPQAGGSTLGGGAYMAGVTQQISAVAFGGWTFNGWNDGIIANPRTIIVPTNDITYLANFTSNGLGQVTITVAANPATGGSCLGGGVFSSGTTILIGATPSNGWAFSQWNDGDQNRQRFIIVPGGNATYTATFRQITATVQVLANPPSAGTTLGSGSYQVGTNVMLSATPNYDWTFIGWADGKVSNPRFLTVPLGGGTYTANFAPNLGAAAGLSTFYWGTGGAAEWYGQTSVKRDGLAAAQSGAIGDGQTSWLQTATNGPGSLLFWWKVSSEANHDYLSFIVDSTTTNRISGNADWNLFACFVGEGLHTFRWEYTKDASGRAGSDAGWLAQTAWLPCPAATNQPQLFFKSPSGLVASWVLNAANGAYQFTRVLANVGDWQPKTVGEIAGDGTGDVLLQSPAGEVYLWLMNADGTIRGTNFLGNTGTWAVRACADFLGDGQPQLFFQNPAGAVAYWQTDTNGYRTNSIFLGNMGTWQLKSAADLDNDLKANLLWQSPGGTVAAWFPTNNTWVGHILGNTGVWDLRGAYAGTTNSNGVLVWQTPTGNSASWFVDTNGAPVLAVPWGNTGTWKLKAASGR